MKAFIRFSNLNHADPYPVSLILENSWWSDGIGNPNEGPWYLGQTNTGEWHLYAQHFPYQSFYISDANYSPNRFSLTYNVTPIEGSNLPDTKMVFGMKRGAFTIIRLLAANILTTTETRTIGQSALNFEALLLNTYQGNVSSAKNSQLQNSLLFPILHISELAPASFSPGGHGIITINLLENGLNVQITGSPGYFIVLYGIY